MDTGNTVGDLNVHFVRKLIFESHPNSANIDALVM